MHVTLDASVIIKWYIASPDEQDAAQALAVLDGIENGGIVLIQPPHALAEAAAVLARETPEHAAANLEELSRIFAVGSVNQSMAAYQRAIELSRTLNHHLFDTLYHAAALEENAMLITADRCYYDKAQALGNIILLEDFSGYR